MDLSKIQPLVVDVLAKKQALEEAKTDSIAAQSRGNSLESDPGRHKHLKDAKCAFIDAIDALSDALGKELTKLEKLVDACDAHLDVDAEPDDE